jgi:ech hydrogenase subunit D
MSETQEITPIEKHELVGIAAEMFAEGYRFVQLSCATLESAYELTYSFDKAYRLRNLRLTVTQDEEVPSISVIYPNAFLYENEIHDLFGLNIRNLAVDYHGTLYKTMVTTPFSIGSITARTSPKTDAGPNVEKPESVKEQTEVSGQQEG